MAKEAPRAGVAGAKVKGNYIGTKPSYSREKLDKAVVGLSGGVPIRFLAKETGVIRQAIYRIRDHSADTEKALVQWGM